MGTAPLNPLSWLFNWIVFSFKLRLYPLHRSVPYNIITLRSQQVFERPRGCPKQLIAADTLHVDFKVADVHPDLARDGARWRHGNRRADLATMWDSSREEEGEGVRCCNYLLRRSWLVRNACVGHGAVSDSSSAHLLFGKAFDV